MNNDWTTECNPVDYADLPLDGVSAQSAFHIGPDSDLVPIESLDAWAVSRLGK